MHFYPFEDCLVWNEDFFRTGDNWCPNYCNGTCINNDKGYLTMAEAHNACKEIHDCYYIAKNESTNMYHLRTDNDCPRDGNPDCYYQKWRTFYCAGY